MQQSVLGHESSKAGFDSAAKLPGKEAKELRSSTKHRADGQVSKADADSKVDVGGGDEGLHEIKCAGEGAGTPYYFAQSRQEKQFALRLEQV